MEEKEYILTYQETDLAPGDVLKNPDYQTKFGRYRNEGKYFVVTKVHREKAYDESVSDFPYQVYVVTCRKATQEEIEVATQAGTL